jgi:hypothetical protein
MRHPVASLDTGGRKMGLSAAAASEPSPEDAGNFFTGKDMGVRLAAARKEGSARCHYAGLKYIMMTSNDRRCEPPCAGCGWFACDDRAWLLRAGALARY